MCDRKPHSEIPARALPYRSSRHVMRCLANDFDTSPGEIFGFHDQFYVELLPRQPTL